MKPDKNRCIETLAKRRYWNAVDRYMRLGEDDIRIENEIEILRRFLEEVDVEGYRSQMESLMEEGKEVCLVLDIDEKGDILVEIKEIA
ncbi:MAG: hypothetical protein ACXQS7_01785 [Candidatus Syntropharchaeia archaeon]